MIATSPDGQWAAIRRGREVSLWANGAAPATSRIELDTDDADLVIVGPPSVLAVVTRGAGPGVGHRMVLYLPPYLDAVAQLDLDAPMRVAAVTGPRVVLVSLDGKAVTIVRIAGRALSAQPVDTASAVEFAVGLERNQVLFSLLRKLEAWDAVSGRPLLRMQLTLPPPPRIVGPAHGHVWAMRPGGDEILVCRLSDGRPFLHHLGASILEVVCHAASPLLILATARGLVRLHCFAHALTVIDAPWEPGVALGQLVVGDDIALLGIGDRDDEPWRVQIAGAGAPALTLDSPDAPSEPLPTAADKLRAMRDRTAPDLIDPGPQRPRERDDFAARFPPVPASDAVDPARGERPAEGFTGGGLPRVGNRHGASAGPAERFTGGGLPRLGDRHGASPVAADAPRGGTDRGGDPFGGGASGVPRGTDRGGDPFDGGASGVPRGTDRGGDAFGGGASGVPRGTDRGGDVFGGGASGVPRGTDRGGDAFGGAGGSGVPRGTDRGGDAFGGGASGVPRGTDRGGDAFGGGASGVPRGTDRGELGVHGARSRAWREPLAAFGAELARGAEAEVPVIGADTEVGHLAHRLALPAAARRALVVLYGMHLVGEPALAIARLAHVLGDWTEALGQGELGTLAMLRRRGGKVALRGSVTDLLDGVGPRAIRMVGSAAIVSRPGAARLARDGKPDAVIESELATQLGRIAVIEGGPALALLEARLHGTTAVALAPPPVRPLPWPRDAGLIVVADPGAPAWVAALPSYSRMT